jgi:hypothetical protein
MSSIMNQYMTGIKSGTISGNNESKTLDYIAQVADNSTLSAT